MAEAGVPGPHLVELGLVGAGHDVQPSPAAGYMVQGGDHLGDHRGVVQQGVGGGPDLHLLGRLGDAGHHGDGLHRRAPVIRLAAEAAPLAHGEDEIQAVALCCERRVQVGLPQAVEGRGRLRDDPPPVGHRQEDPEVPFGCRRVHGGLLLRRHRRAPRRGGARGSDDGRGRCALRAGPGGAGAAA